MGNDHQDDEDDAMINCITSIGDSLSEYNASHTASQYLKNRILNRVRFKPHPSIDDMLHQLKQILQIYKDFGITHCDIELDNSFLPPMIESSSDTSISSSSSCVSEM